MGTGVIVSYPSPMHIAHFVPRTPPALGGSEAYFERLRRFHEAHGDTVTTWTTTAIDLEAFWKSGGREAEPGPHRYRPWRFPLRRYLLKAASLIPYAPLQAATLPASPLCPRMWWDAGRFADPLGAVHATAFPYAFPILCARRLAKRCRVPFLLTPFLHVGDQSDPTDRTKRQYTSRPLRWLLTEADAVFVQTEMEANVVRDCGVPAAKIVLQGLGVDPAECTDGERTAARQRWGVAEGDFVVGHLANNSIEKGTVDLLKAWQPKHDRALVLAGPAMPNFESFWQTYPQQSSIRRLGVLDESEKRDFFAGIDAFALPSRSDSFGLVLLEAWANRKPVIVYCAGGPGEIVRDGVDGLVTVCRPDALADAIAKLAGDPTLRRRMGDAGFDRATTDFRWADKLEIVRRTIREIPGFE